MCRIRDTRCARCSPARSENLPGCEHRSALLLREHVFEIAQVEQVHDFFASRSRSSRHRWHAAALGPQIKARVGERSERQVNYAFVGTQPAELRMLRKSSAQITPKSAISSSISRPISSLPSHSIASQTNCFPEPSVSTMPRAEDLFVGFRAAWWQMRTRLPSAQRRCPHLAPAGSARRGFPEKLSECCVMSLTRGWWPRLAKL